MAASTALLSQWGVSRQRAGGELPARGVYGIPVQWPHVTALYERAGLADVGNLHVEERHRRRGIAAWLLGQAAGWLELAGASQLLDYAWLDGTDPGGHDYTGYRAFLHATGFRELTRTRRGWTRTP